MKEQRVDTSKQEEQFCIEVYRQHVTKVMDEISRCVAYHCEAIGVSYAIINNVHILSTYAVIHYVSTGIMRCRNASDDYLVDILMLFGNKPKMDESYANGLCQMLYPERPCG